MQRPGGAANGQPRRYFKTTKASRSTRGRPDVPTTTSLIVRVAQVDQVCCQATARYWVEERCKSTVPL